MNPCWMKSMPDPPTTGQGEVMARLAAYRFLLAALAKPTAEQHEWFDSDAFVTSLGDLCYQFEVEPPTADPAAEDAGDHTARYIACFEVGVPTPPVPLLASHYNRKEPVTAIIHEHILFYRRFGMKLSAGNIEPADHLLNELAFLVRLDELIVQGESPASILRARRDFLRRHAVRWIDQAAAAAKKELPEVYATLLALLAAVVEQDLTVTEAGLEDQP